MDRAQLTTVYFLISELFLYPEERDTARIATAMAALKTAPPELTEPLKTFLASPLANSAEEYVATLELAPVVSLYLGSHLYDEPQSCRGAGMSGRNGYMLELSNIYRHFGVELAGAELADFTPVMIEFLGVSMGCGEQDQIGLRRYFVETLLVNGIEALLSALQKCESPYVHLVEALRVALAEDIMHMVDDPKWQPPAKDSCTQDSVAARDLADNRTAIGEGAEL